MLQKIIDFILSLFGIKPKKQKQQQPASPDPTIKIPKTKKPAEEKTRTPPRTLEKIAFKLPNVTLSLGCYDSHVPKAAIRKTLDEYHQNMFGVKDSVKTSKFRHGDLHDWINPKKVNGDPVTILQQFLVDAGFLPPFFKPGGIFGYGTQAGVRLFQEYVRTIEGNTSIGIPDGVIGKKGWQHIKRWAENRQTASEWQRGRQSDEYRKWLDILDKAKKYYADNSHPILDKVNTKIDQLGNVDTLKTTDWKTGANDIHLIGIRRKEEKSQGLRKNDDIFVLLINGMVFKFWGSTDPNHGAKARPDEAFLAEGQHKFRFGWHNRSTENN